MTRNQKTYAIVGGSAAILTVLGVVVYTKTKGASNAPATPAQTKPASSTNALPNGLAGTVTMSDGAQSVSAKIGTQVAIALPVGGAWVSLTSTALGGISMLGAIAPGSAQPVPAIVGPSDTWTGVWRDANGATHTGMVSVTAQTPQLVV